MGFSLVARRYQGNRGCFIFLRLLICLSSAGSPARTEVVSSVGATCEHRRFRKNTRCPNNVRSLRAPLRVFGYETLPDTPWSHPHTMIILQPRQIR